MKTRAAKFLAAMIASILSSANVLAAPDQTEPPEPRADTCLTSPRDYTPPGTRWRYRLERGTGRHCWFLKNDAEKTAGKAAEPSAGATEEPAATTARRKAPTRSASDARAEFTRTPFEQDARPAATPSAPAASAAVAESSQPSTANAANMLAPSTATRWPDPTATTAQANPAAAAPAEPNAEVRQSPATTPAAKPQVMPRAVPPMPASEKPMSLPMLITIIAGGLSVLGVLVSLLLAWLSSRRTHLTPSAPMPPLDVSDQPRRPGDLYRQRQRLRAQKEGRYAA